jgi:hypothetical protein
MTVYAEKLPVKGYSPFLSDQGDALIYVDNLSKELRSYDFKSRSQTSLGKSSKGMLVYGIHSNTIILQDRKHNFDFIAIDIQEGSNRPYSFGKEMIVYPSQDLRSIIISKDTSKYIINPIDNCDYINVSLSPNKMYILFRATGKGVYVTDLEGKILAAFPGGQFPSWVNDTTILMAKVEDDGHQYLSSNLFFANILTEELSPIQLQEKPIPLFPVSVNGGRTIVFNTPNNELYLLEVRQ